VRRDPSGVLRYETRVTSRFSPKPDWLKVRAPGGDTYHRLKETFRKLDLHTVCEEARCPNVGECWREGTATVMLLGDVCTRGCRFCAVTTGDPRGAVDVREPEHVARTEERLKKLQPDILIETLVGDFQGHTAAVDTVVDAGPDVFAHNVECVRRLQRSVRDVRSSYELSLAVLRRAKERIASRVGSASAGAGTEPQRRRLTKSSIMVGLGESDDEVIETLRDLRGASVDVVTIGQYLRPTPKHHEVIRFVHPETFDAYARAALDMGFLYAASGPLVRSSYRAAEVFLRSVLGTTEAAESSHGETHGVLPPEWTPAPGLLPASALVRR
jgi:lipoyl synthase